jgi:hypothetical protein
MIEDLAFVNRVVGLGALDFWLTLLTAFHPSMSTDIS